MDTRPLNVTLALACVGMAICFRLIFIICITGQRTLLAITPGNINFDAVKLGDTSIRDYTLYRAAKGLYHGRLGVAADELADEELVSDNTLLMILNAALIARFGPKVMEIGRNEDNV